MALRTPEGTALEGQIDGMTNPNIEGFNPRQSYNEVLMRLGLTNPDQKGDAARANAGTQAGNKLLQRQGGQSAGAAQAAYQPVQQQLAGYISKVGKDRERKFGREKYDLGRQAMGAQQQSNLGWDTLNDNSKDTIRDIDLQRIMAQQSANDQEGNAVLNGILGIAGLLI
jgi:hypothetical protein